MQGNSELEDIKKSIQQWEKENAENLGKERKREFLTDAGVPLKTVYTPLDLAEKV